MKNIGAADEYHYHTLIIQTRLSYKIIIWWSGYESHYNGRDCIATKGTYYESM
jgi:hypothetical protein